MHKIKNNPISDDDLVNKKYVDSTCTDELVKMDSTTDAKHLSELIDKSTIVNDNGVLKVKKLDGQEVTIAEINRLKGLTMNVMDLVNSFANGGVKVYEHTIPTYADLSALDRSGFIDGIKYFVYVQSDETHGGAKTTYICDKKNTSYFCVSGDHRDFTTSPIDLANEVTGKLGTSNIDVDALWKLLTINDTYKTLTTKNEPFGTHGAKALYDELVTAIGNKANKDDFDTHIADTAIHITQAEKDSLNTHKDDTTIHIISDERTKWNDTADKVEENWVIDDTRPSDSTTYSSNKINISIANVNTLAPVGSVIAFAGNTAPIGYLLCDGSAVSREDYNVLFSVIGTTYGEGDGSTTFNLPNLKDRFVQGTGTNAVGTVMSAGLPNITGRTSYPTDVPRDGAFYSTTYGKETFRMQGGVGNGALGFDASRSSSIYGKSDTVQPPSVVMNYIIKY